jgi:hypothetical protein
MLSLLFLKILTVIFQAWLLTVQAVLYFQLLVFKHPFNRVRKRKVDPVVKVYTGTTSEGYGGIAARIVT